MVRFILFILVLASIVLTVTYITLTGKNAQPQATFPSVNVAEGGNAGARQLDGYSSSKFTVDVVSWWEPRVYLLPSFIPSTEREKLKQAGIALLTGNPVQDWGGVMSTTPGKQWPPFALLHLQTSCFENVEEVIHMPLNHADTVRVVRLTKDLKIPTHSDAIVGDDPDGRRAGQRVTTAIWCFQGTTVMGLPALGKSVRCHDGDVIIIHNTFADVKPDPNAIYTLVPLNAESLVGVQYYRQESVRAFGRF